MAVVFNGNVANYLQKDIAFSTGKGTIVGWIRPTSTPSSYQSFFQMNAVDNQQVNYTTSVDGLTTSIYLGAANSGTGASVTGSTLVVGRDYHLGLTWDGTSLRAYLNGVLDITNTNTGSTWNEVRLGFDEPYWGDSFLGNMWDILAWDAVLSVDQIRRQMLQSVLLYSMS